MIVMPANCTGMHVGYLAGKYPGTLGHLFSPGAARGPYSFMPYALDNGAFSAFTTGKPWEEGPWIKLLQWAKDSGQDPLWVLVPDVVGEKWATIRRWARYRDTAKAFGWPVAFAVQDGMTPVDVPGGVDVVFVGGSTDWKRSTLGMWCSSFPRVHIGRINTYKWLKICQDAGAESVDGTGWFRGDPKQRQEIEQWCSEQPRPL